MIVFKTKGFLNKLLTVSKNCFPALHIYGGLPTTTVYCSTSTLQTLAATGTNVLRTSTTMYNCGSHV